MMNLASIANNIEFIDGIWYSKGNSAISYPEEGNTLYYQIEDDSFWFNHRNGVITDIIKNFSPNGCLFDVGGGNGFVTKSLLDNQIDVVLVEPGIHGIENAKKRGVTNLLCSTLEDAKFNKGSLPAIGIFDVLEHVEKGNEFLKSLSWLLEPGGYLYITVPAYKFLWSHEDKYAGHFRRYTLKRLNTLLTDSGFIIKYKSYFFSFLPLPIFLFRTLPYLLGRKKNSNTISSHKNEHAPKHGLVGKILTYLLQFERKRILNSKSLPFGGSFLVVAQNMYS